MQLRLRRWVNTLQQHVDEQSSEFDVGIGHDASIEPDTSDSCAAAWLAADGSNDALFASKASLNPFAAISATAVELARHQLCSMYAMRLEAMGSKLKHCCAVSR